MYIVRLYSCIFFFVFCCFNGIYSGLPKTEIFIVDIYRLSPEVVVSSIYNSSNPNEYVTNVADPDGKYPIVTKSPIDKPKLINKNTVQILGKEYKVQDNQPIGLQRCSTPLYKINSCQKICISGHLKTSLSIFNTYALVYSTPKAHFQLNITNHSTLKVDGEKVDYAITSCSVTTLNTLFWGFLIFAVIFSVLIFALFAFEIIEYLRFKADMKDPLIIGGEIKTISSRDFSLESLSSA
ncbi:putative signal peptide-containing protein [Cryptosporidium canis]|uniref:Signal peptide-containing protein n=1 Tax=Cryptosporidium canis TaxID=195482 RepID=A0A9D5DH75_9CRYT|nr:putative signal peptide-containing protein [Cryptosporidium canis]